MKNLVIFIFLLSPNFLFSQEMTGKDVGEIFWKKNTFKVVEENERSGIVVFLVDTIKYVVLFETSWELQTAKDMANFEFQSWFAFRYGSVKTTIDSLGNKHNVVRATIRNVSSVDFKVYQLDGGKYRVFYLYKLPGDYIVDNKKIEN